MVAPSYCHTALKCFRQICRESFKLMQLGASDGNVCVVIITKALTCLSALEWFLVGFKLCLSNAEAGLPQNLIHSASPSLLPQIAPSPPPPRVSTFTVVESSCKMKMCFTCTILFSFEKFCSRTCSEREAKGPYQVIFGVFALSRTLSLQE